MEKPIELKQKRSNQQSEVAQCCQSTFEKHRADSATFANGGTIGFKDIHSLSTGCSIYYRKYLTLCIIC